MYLLRWFGMIRSQWSHPGQGVVLRLGLTTLHFLMYGFRFSLPIWAPHWTPKSVTNISLLLLVLLDTLQLATEATGLFSQGVTAVVHGCSIHALGKSLHCRRGVGWSPPVLVTSHAKLNSEYPLEYSYERTQTSSFSCKVYWETGTGSWKLCHNNTMECNTQVQTLHCRCTCHSYTQSYTKVNRIKTGHKRNNQKTLKYNKHTL